MAFLYITPDIIGMETGGGVVTANEFRALSSMGETVPFYATPEMPSDPFQQDEFFLQSIRHYVANNPGPIPLVHCYSGCLGKTVEYVKSIGAKVTYTVAAHDRFISRKAHLDVGIPFDYPHLTDDAVWREYSRGIMQADLVITPSSHSSIIVKREGYMGPMRLIPHGVDLPKERVTRYPSAFTLGYLGVVGADKGLVSLMKAWKKLAYKDATLIMGGHQTVHPHFSILVKRYGGGNIHLSGWVKNKSDWFDSISVYCQPSMTEGFGITVLEAMAHGKRVLCSTGAGVCDLISGHWRFPAGDVDYLCSVISRVKNSTLVERSVIEQEQKATAAEYTWDKMRQRYIDVWKEML